MSMTVHALVWCLFWTFGKSSVNGNEGPSTRQRTQDSGPHMGWGSWGGRRGVGRRHCEASRSEHIRCVIDD